MTRPRKRETIAALELLDDLDKSYDDVLRELTEQGVDMTADRLRALASFHGRSRGGHPHRAKQTGLIPWVLLQEHRMHNYMRLLRWEARRRTKAPLSDQQLTQLDSWKGHLLDNDLVVHYDGVNKPVLVPRRYTRVEGSGVLVPLDTDLIRDPSIEGP